MLIRGGACRMLEHTITLYWRSVGSRSGGGDVEATQVIRCCSDGATAPCRGRHGPASVITERDSAADSRPAACSSIQWRDAISPRRRQPRQQTARWFNWNLFLFYLQFLIFYWRFFLPFLFRPSVTFYDLVLQIRLTLQLLRGVNSP